MRWLFLFVLMVNIAYVAWELDQPEGSGPVIKKHKDVAPILLLSELEQAEETMPQLEEVETKSELQQIEAEAEFKSIDKPEQVTATPVVVEQVTAEAPTCYTLGPFRKLENLRIFTRAIKDYVDEASFRSRDEQEQSMFWVYLPPRADLNKARALGKRLEKMDISDYYIISKGDEKNGISLGHFKEKDRAYNYADSIKKRGFKPVVDPVFRSYTIYWLDYTLASHRSIPEAVFEQYLGSNIKRLDRPCT